MNNQIMTLKEFLEFSEAFEMNTFIKNLSDDKLIDIFKRTYRDLLKSKSEEYQKDSLFEIAQYLFELSQRNLLDKVVKIA